MGRNLSPSLSDELENLGKDAESAKSAMKTLKLYLRDLDSKAIPLFLAKVSENKSRGSSIGEYTISLYEVLARVHGPKIVSHSNDIMSTIIKTLATSGGSFPLQQACSKVVPAIARYGIEPTMQEHKKRAIIHSLSKPLSDSLLSSQESLSCGASLCLKALVDCDNWRFASDEMVNEVCLKLASALKDTPSQTNSHMGLVMSLAKSNSFVVEAYARLLVNSGLNILNCGSSERNSQKRLTAIQMVHSLMKCLDIRSILSELEVIIEDMEKCQSDEMPYVKGAAFEALQTAKKLLVDKGSQMTDFDVLSVTGSNFGRSGNSGRRNLSSSGSGSRSPLSGTRSPSPLSGSPESQNLGSYALYESYMESPISTCQVSCNVNHSRKNVNRKLWRGNGCADVYLENGLFSELTREGSDSHVSSQCNEQYGTMKTCGFPGFVAGNQANGGLRSRTPSPPRTSSQLNVDSIKIFTTPRKLLRSLQDDDDDENSGDFINKVRRRSSPVTKYDEHGHHNRDRLKDDGGNMIDGCNESRSDSESVSSTEDVTLTNVGSQDELHGGKNQSLQAVKNSRWNIVNMFNFVFLAIFVALALVLWSGNQDSGLNLVPT